MSGLNVDEKDGTEVEEPYSWINEQFVNSVVKGLDVGKIWGQAEKLTPKDWQKILVGPLDQFKKQLPRLTSFLMIKELTKWSMGPMGSLETPPEVLKKPKEIGLGTRCLEMRVRSSTRDDEGKASSNLLLTSQGVWLLWVSQYRKRKSEIKGEGPTRTATQSEFTIIQQENLISTMVEATGISAWKVVRGLFQGMTQHMAQARRNKLDDVQHLEYAAERIFEICDERLGLGNESLFFSDRP